MHLIWETIGNICKAHTDKKSPYFYSQKSNREQLLFYSSFALLFPSKNIPLRSVCCWTIAKCINWLSSGWLLRCAHSQLAHCWISVKIIGLPKTFISLNQILDARGVQFKFSDFRVKPKWSERACNCICLLHELNPNGIPSTHSNSIWFCNWCVSLHFFSGPQVSDLVQLPPCTNRRQGHRTYCSKGTLIWLTLTIMHHHFGTTNHGTPLLVDVKLC